MIESKEQYSPEEYREKIASTREKVIEFRKKFSYYPGVRIESTRVIDFLEYTDTVPNLSFKLIEKINLIISDIEVFMKIISENKLFDTEFEIAFITRRRTLKEAMKIIALNA